jgi:hypothetical protein
MVAIAPRPLLVDLLLVGVTGHHGRPRWRNLTVRRRCDSRSIVTIAYNCGLPTKAPKALAHKGDVLLPRPDSSASRPIRLKCFTPQQFRISHLGLRQPHNQSSAEDIVGDSTVNRMR